MLGITIQERNCYIFKPTFIFNVLLILTNNKFCGFLSLNNKFSISAMTKPFPGFIELSQQLQFSHHYTELFINMILKSSSKSYVYWDTLHTVGYYSKICYTVENLFLIILVFPLYNIKLKLES